MKKYKLGMYLGRFQPFHNGHKAIVDKMLEECEEVVIVVGSADKMGTM
jgi:cytidyltransferase-like protein